MTELIIIKTNESEKIKKFCQQEHIDYEIRSIPQGQIYQDGEKPAQKVSETELGQAYREVWSNPQRYQKAQKWEKVAVSDWAKRSKKEPSVKTFNKNLHKK